MKKFIFVILMLILIPFNINAESLAESCDYTKEVELNKLASKISYERKFNKENNSFTVTLYNVISDLYVKYNNKLMYGDSNNEIVITGIEEGSYMEVIVYSSGTNCYSSLMTIYINLPYFNSFYNTKDCSGYEDILTICSSQFLTYKVDVNILSDAIDNYNNKIYNPPASDEVKDTSIINGVKEFVSLWGMKIFLTLATAGLSIWYFQVKLRKTKHGI